MKRADKQIVFLDLGEDVEKTVDASSAVRPSMSVPRGVLGERVYARRRIEMTDKHGHKTGVVVAKHTQLTIVKNRDPEGISGLVLCEDRLSKQFQIDLSDLETTPGVP